MKNFTFFMIVGLLIGIIVPVQAQMKNRLSSTVYTVPHILDTLPGFVKKKRPGKSDTLSLKPNVKDYPYLTTTFYFRNREKLADKKYIKNILSVKYLYVETSFAYEALDKTNIEVKAPLFIVERDRGKYSSSLFEDMTLVNKVPYNQYGSSIPSVSCYTKRVSKNKLKLISELTALYKPMIGTDPFSSLSNITNFVDDVVNKLAVDETLEIRSSFPTFSVRDIDIIPSMFKVLIFHATDEAFEGNTLRVIEETGGYLSVTRNGKPLENPYIIIQTGLSDYVALGGLPSEALDEFMLCNPNREQIVKLGDFLLEHKGLLSPDQFRNEQFLITLLERVVAINDGLLGERDQKTDKVVLAYDFYCDRNNLNERSGSLYAKHYKNIVQSMFRCYQSSGLVYSETCDELIEQMNIDPNWENYAVFDMMVKNISVLAQEPVMEKTKILRMARAESLRAENKLYARKVAPLVLALDRALTAGKITSAANDAEQKLKSQLLEFNACRLCGTQSSAVLNRYNTLLQKENASLSDVIQDKLELEGKASEVLFKLGAQLPTSSTTDTLAINTHARLKTCLADVQQLEITGKQAKSESALKNWLIRLENNIHAANLLVMRKPQFELKQE